MKKLILVFASLLITIACNAQDITYKKIYPTETINNGYSENYYEYTSYWDLFVNDIKNYDYDEILLKFQVSGFDNDIHTQYLPPAPPDSVLIVENIHFQALSGIQYNFVEKESKWYHPYAWVKGSLQIWGEEFRCKTSNLPWLRIEYSYDGEHFLSLENVEITYKNKKDNN